MLCRSDPQLPGAFVWDYCCHTTFDRLLNPGVHLHFPQALWKPGNFQSVHMLSNYNGSIRSKSWNTGVLHFTASELQEYLNARLKRPQFPNTMFSKAATLLVHRIHHQLFTNTWGRNAKAGKYVLEHQIPRNTQWVLLEIPANVLVSPSLSCIITIVLHAEIHK